MSIRQTQQPPTFADHAFRKYGRELQQYLLRRLRNRQDARDLSQEVWTRLLRIQNPEHVVKPLAYIMRTAANVLAEYRMREKRDPVEFDSIALDHAGQNPLHVDADELGERLSTERHVQHLLRGLPATYRQILLLRLCDGLSYREIAAKVGLTAATTEKYFFRAMSAVRSAK